MNLETLRIFCDVIDHRSFSRGASIHQVSQSAATQSVHRLEKMFGVRLIDRNRRPLVLTPEGRICYESFRDILQMYDGIGPKLQLLRKEISGLVRVAAIYSVGFHEMSSAMQEFMRSWPKAKIRLEYLRPNRIYEAILRSQADLGVLAYPVATPDLTVIPLRSEPMVLVCPKDHPFANRSLIRPQELANQEFVGFDRDLPIRKGIDRYFRQIGITVRTVMEFDNIETVKEAVMIGSGVAILPEPTVRTSVRNGDFIQIPLQGNPLQRPLGIIYRQRETLTPAAIRFIETLQARQNEG